MLRNCRTGQRQPPAWGGAAVPRTLLTLVDFRAAALDQKSKHDHKKRSRNDADNHLTVHVLPPFFNC